MGVLQEVLKQIAIVCLCTSLEEVARDWIGDVFVIPAEVVCSVNTSYTLAVYYVDPAFQLAE